MVPLNDRGLAQTDDHLTRFWGKPLDCRDVQICEALDWADNDRDVWVATDMAKAFSYSVHFNGEARKFHFDQPLLEFMSSRQLMSLDRFFGRTDSRHFPMRTLLTLIQLSMDGCANCQMHKDTTLYFSATKSLNPERTPEQDTFVREMEREGALVYALGSSGQEIVLPTPHGMLPGLDEATADELKLRPIMTELESRGFARLSGQTSASRRWHLTPRGVSVGLDSKNASLADVLLELGIDRRLINEASLSFRLTQSQPQ